MKNLQIWPRKRGFEKRVFLLLVEIVSGSFGDSYENYSDHFACSQNFVMVLTPLPPNNSLHHYLNIFVVHTCGLEANEKYHLGMI